MTCTRRSFAAIACCVIVTFAMASRAEGAFAGSTSNGSSSLAAATLAPPTGVQVTFHCQLLGILLPVADVTWSPTSDAWAEGYQLDRFVGSTLDESLSVVGQATTLLSDGLSLPHLSLSTTYTWHLRATFHSWTSSDALVSATTPLFC